MNSIIMAISRLQEKFEFRSSFVFDSKKVRLILVRN
jgi:hypothetical protein